MPCITSKVLKNFNSMLLSRQMSVPMYEGLLNIHNDEPGNWRDKENALMKSINDLETDERLKQLISINEEDIHNSLSVIVKKTCADEEDEDYIIYWSTTNGSTLLAKEVKMIFKIMNNLKIHRCITISTCDKKVNVNLNQGCNRIEFFPYVSFIMNIMTHKYGVAGAQILSKCEWNGIVETNPVLKELIIPVVHLNDPLVLFMGADAGNVIKIDRHMFLSGSYSDGEIIYRKVGKYVDRRRLKGGSGCMTGKWMETCDDDHAT